MFPTIVPKVRAQKATAKTPAKDNSLLPEVQPKQNGGLRDREPGERDRRIDARDGKKAIEAIVVAVVVAVVVNG